MRAEFLALLTAAAWGVGGYFEKKGLTAGNLPPQVGIAIRTAVAFVVLGVLSSPQWKAIGSAGWRSISSVAVGGGVVAGSLGMLCFYAALKEAPLSRVLPIAFTSPLFGAAMGVFFAGEPVSFRMVAGLLMSVGGIALLTGR